MISSIGLSIQFLTKEVYTGSPNGIRYLLRKEEDVLKVCVYPEPYCFEATNNDDKTWNEFPFSPEGLNKALLWIEDYQNQHPEKFTIF